MGLAEFSARVVYTSCALRRNGTICGKTRVPQDNAPNLKALLVKMFLAKQDPCNFLLFTEIKSALKGTKFETVEAVKEKAIEVMNRIMDNDQLQVK
ncbi:hypothetical protein J6590_023787 [Homalodisca vitripennis]|nr:hypothetical protein J6590_023787 [Homalodisca vitripennis]